MSDETPVFNQEKFLDLAHNAMSMRSDLLRKFMDPRRDYDKECGYPETRNITVQDYRRIYDRDPVASRVVDILPDECWKVQPTVYEDEDADTVTDFEESWDNLGRSLKGGSFYQDEEGSPIWEYLWRLDRLCGIGSFGVLLFGLNDIQEGETLEKPVSGFEQWNSQFKNPKPIGTPYTPEPVDRQAPDGGKSLTSPQEDTPVNDKPQEDIQLLFLRVFDESLVQIVQYDSNVASPRFGQPVVYELTFIDPNDQSKSGVGLPLVTQRVHWTRILHVADNLTSSEIFGDPRCRCVFNRLIDLTKLYGGSAEMYWKGAFPGISLNIDPKMGGDIQVDQDGIRDAMWKYTNSLQRWFALAGVSATSLSPQVVDPTQQINVQIQAVCIKLAVPERIFMGSERGELASSQDAGSWNGRLKGRQITFITPKLIVPFVDRLIQFGVLPQPKGFSVDWPSLESLSPTEQATVASTIVSTLGTYISMGCEVLLEPIDLYTRVLKFSEEEAQAILDNRSSTLEDQKAKAEEQEAMAQLGQLQGMDPSMGEEEELTEEPPVENVLTILKRFRNKNVD